jgi:hypothetical protein
MCCRALGERMSDLQPTAHPNEERSSTAALLFGVFAAPLAWAAQLALNFALSASSCFNQGVALPLVRDAGWSHRSLLLALNLGAMAIAAVGAAVSYRAFRRASSLNPHGAGLASARSLAGAGLMSCAVFVIAMLFSLFVAVASPQCSG